MKRNEFVLPGSVDPLECMKHVGDDRSEVTMCRSDKDNLSLG